MPPFRGKHSFSQKTMFSFSCRRRTRRNDVQDGVPVRGRGDDHLLPVQRGHPGHQGQLRPILHRHLQQARIHRLVGQLHEPKNNQSPPNGVSEKNSHVHRNVSGKRKSAFLIKKQKQIDDSHVISQITFSSVLLKRKVHV